MAGSYSQDLRDRVIDAVEKEGMSRRAAAVRFGVSESSAIKWVRRWRLTGSRAPAGTGGHRPSALKPHLEFIKGVLAERPDLTLAAIGKRLRAERSVKADSSMLSRFFRRQGITFKKRRWSPASKSGRTSAAIARAGANIKA
jgi:transposase